MIHHHFVILELSSPVLKSVEQKFFVMKMCDSCVIHKNYEKLHHKTLDLYGNVTSDEFFISISIS